jgi:hypothetical protein
VDFPFKEITEFSEQVLSMTASPLDSPHVYGKQFFTLFLRDALRREGMNQSQKDTLKNLLKRPQDSLADDLHIRPITGTVGSSLFNTYALSTVLLTMEKTNDEAMEALEEAIDPTDPLRIRYEGGGKFESHRGSSARAVPLHLARYVNLPKNRDSIRKDLTSAIQNYGDHLPSLMAHLRRGGFHEGPDALAPYYLYATIPYQTAAIELLLQEGRQEGRQEEKPEEKMMLEDLREKTKAAILSLVREDGQFYVPEYFSSPGYVNPLFGLALIPLAKDCVKEDLENHDLLGILSGALPK